MENRFLNFKKQVMRGIFLVILLLIVIIFINNLYSEIIYNITFLLFLLVVTITIFVTTISVLVTQNVFKNKKCTKYQIPFVKFSLAFLIPLMVFIASTLKKDKDGLRSIYVLLNNYLVNTNLVKYNAKDILIIVPHCLQNNMCNIKVTNDIKQCKECGKCNIENLKKISTKYNVNTLVVTGGTAARNSIKNMAPKFIISVACERDLVSGLMDVKLIPVIGIVNKRPNGPCFNTSMDYKELENTLEKVLKKEKL